MTVKRIVANIATTDLARADQLYSETFGLDLTNGPGWIGTCVRAAKLSVQVSLASEGGSGTPVRDLE